MKLGVSDSIEIKIRAKEKWNPTNLEVSKGEQYEFLATGKWKDFIISTDANGYTNFYMRLFDSKKRAKKYLWFALIGSLNMNEKNDFLIGKSNTCSFDDDGKLYCYANDINWFYWNNCGHITLKIKRIK